MKKVGTLKELDVKPGDVVERNGRNFIVMNGSPCPWYKGTWASCAVSFNENGEWISGSAENCRIVSRASDKPKLWRDMTDAEKSALLLAYHKGKVIQYYSHDFLDWYVVSGEPFWSANYAYRVRPEPKVDTVKQGYKTNSSGKFVTTSSLDHATHVVTFNLIDGKPDYASIKMEPIE